MYFLLASCGRAGGEDIQPVPSEADLIPADVVDDEGSPGSAASLQFDRLGRPHIAYFEAFQKSLRYVHFVQSSDLGGQWLPQTSVPILDVSGIPFPGQSRSIVGQDIDVGSKAGTEGMGSFNQLILDPSDRPFVAYYDDDLKKLKLAWGASEDRKTRAWTFNTVFLDGDRPSVGKWVAAALDESGVLHAAYLDEILLELRYVRWDPSTWNPDVDGESPSTPGEFVDSVGIGMQVGLAVSRSDAPVEPGRVYIVYYTAADANLRLASRPVQDQGGWSITILDDLPAKEGESAGDTIAEDVGRWAALALDSQGYLHISYFDDTGKDLKYLQYDPKRQKAFPRFKRIHDYDKALAFTKEEHFTFDESGNRVGTDLRDVRLAEPLTSRAIQNKTGIEIVREWVGMVVDDGRTVGSGFESDIAIGPHDTPLISYRDAGNGDLKIAVMTLKPEVRLNPTSFLGFTSDVTWDVKAIDTPMIRGIWSSIDTFPSDSPDRWRIGIAYEGFERVEGTALSRRLMFALFSMSTLELF